jgi:hypothetical protein
VTRMVPPQPPQETKAEPPPETKAVSRLKIYLVNLTSRRASNLFLLALGVGVIAIWFDVLLPWVPVFVVLLYGLTLFYATTFLYVSLSEMTSNSPYFLGFLFFLFSIYRSFSAFETSQLTTSKVIGQLGSALLATLVGLAFRQLIFAYSPGQADQDTFFRTLEEELRSSATQYKKSQAELVGLLHEFVASRELLFTEEAKASKRFVQNMEKTAKVFDSAFENYPTMISTALTESAKGVTKLRKAIDEMAISANELKPPLFNETAREVDALKVATADLTKHISALGESMIVMTRSSGTAASSSLETFKKIEQEVKAVDAILEDFINVMRNKIAAFR